MFRPALKSGIVLGIALASLTGVSSEAVSSVALPAVQLIVGEEKWDLTPRLNDDKKTWSFGEEGQEIRTEEFLVRINTTMDPDPSIAYGIAVTDFGAASSFAFIFLSPIVPTGPGTIVNASIVGGLTDFTGDGVSMTPFLDPTTIQQSAVGAPSTSMGVDVGPAFSADPGPAGAFHGYGPDAAGPTAGPVGIWTILGITTSFTLSGGGDIAVLTGFAEVVTAAVPDAGPGLIGLGTLVLVTLFGSAARRKS